MKLFVKAKSTVLWVCNCIEHKNLTWSYYPVQPFDKQLQTRKMKIFINYYVTKSPSIFNLKLFFHFVMFFVMMFQEDTMYYSSRYVILQIEKSRLGEFIVVPERSLWWGQMGQNQLNSKSVLLH